MPHEQLVDHLFRHQYGKMVSILTRAFGLQHVHTIEDAVQDTFAKAVLLWRVQLPDNPEGWLVRACKNRMIDLLRQIQASDNRISKISGPTAIAIESAFGPDEIADSQLAMIFTACHPSLAMEDQVAFALKTISGFSEKEIAAALLTKRETIKKRLQRARTRISREDIALIIPTGNELSTRLDIVLKVIYYIYNEGYHSTQTASLVRDDLCGEALRLCKMIIDTNRQIDPATYALMALMCFHTARLAGRFATDGSVISLADQDRSLWDDRLIRMGHHYMSTAVDGGELTSYHYQAAISAEHCKAATYQETRWPTILHYYQKLATLQPSDLLQLNIAIVHLEAGNHDICKSLLDNISPTALGNRGYLWHATKAKYYAKTGNQNAANQELQIAITGTTNLSEQEYFIKKLASLQAHL